MSHLLLQLGGRGLLNLVLNVVLFGLIIVNLRVQRLNRRTLKKLNADSAKLAKYYDDRASMLIDALEKMAAATCPLCAVAAGHGRIRGPEGELEAEAEHNGEHIVHIFTDAGVRNGTADCRALEARANARKVFADFVQSLEKEKKSA